MPPYPPPGRPRVLRNTRPARRNQIRKYPHNEAAFRATRLHRRRNGKSTTPPIWEGTKWDDLSRSERLGSDDGVRLRRPLLTWHVSKACPEPDSGTWKIRFRIPTLPSCDSSWLTERALETNQSQHNSPYTKWNLCMSPIFVTRGRDRGTGEAPPRPSSGFTGSRRRRR